MKVHKEIRQKY